MTSLSASLFKLSGSIVRTFKERFVVLRGHQLLYHESKNDQKPYGSFSLVGAVVSSVEFKVHSRAFVFAVTARVSEQQQYVFACGSADERDRWMASISSLASRVSRIPPVSTERGQTARPERDSATCCGLSCQKEFTVFRRKTHCKNCGLAFCAACSSKSCRLPEFGLFEPTKVCDSCYDALTGLSADFLAGGDAAVPDDGKSEVKVVAVDAAPSAAGSGEGAGAGAGAAVASAVLPPAEPRPLLARAESLPAAAVQRSTSMDDFELLDSAADSGALELKQSVGCGCACRFLRVRHKRSGKLFALRGQPSQSPDEESRLLLRARDVVRLNSAIAWPAGATLRALDAFVQPAQASSGAGAGAPAGSPQSTVWLLLDDAPERLGPSVGCSALQWTANQRLDAMQQLCAAVGAAHSKRIPLQLLRSDRVALGPGGAQARLDWACFSDGCGGRLDAYSAPELLSSSSSSGSDSLTADRGMAADRFALGVVLFELFNGGAQLSKASDGSASPLARYIATVVARKADPEAELAALLSKALPESQRTSALASAVCKALAPLLHPDPARRPAAIVVQQALAALARSLPPATAGADSLPAAGAERKRVVAASTADPVSGRSPSPEPSAADSARLEADIARSQLLRSQRFRSARLVPAGLDELESRSYVRVLDGELEQSQRQQSAQPAAAAVAASASAAADSKSDISVVAAAVPGVYLGQYSQGTDAAAGVLASSRFDQTIRQLYQQTAVAESLMQISEQALAESKATIAVDAAAVAAAERKGDSKAAAGEAKAPGAAGSAAAKPIRLWSVSDVLSFWDSLDSAFSEYRDAISRNSIDGHELLDLNESSLVQLGVTNAFHQRRLLREIEQLRQREAAEMKGMQQQVDEFRALDFSEIQLGRVLASGHFGTAQLASWRNTWVVVKTLKAPTLTESQLVDFKREAAMCERVGRHPNVVSFIGACLRPRVCMVTEFVPNGSVEDVLIKRRLFQGDFASGAWRSVVQMALDAAVGVAHLHRERVVHRDLALRNLLLDAQWRVKVCDLGMARLHVGGSGEAGDLTRTMSTVGPLAWMSPESMEQKFSDKSDVFSFGVVMWEFLVRDEPWKQLTHKQVVAASKQQARLTIPAGAPEAWAQLMRDCWEQQPERRPTMQQVATRLRDYLAALVAAAAAAAATAAGAAAAAGDRAEPQASAGAAAERKSDAPAAVAAGSEQQSLVLQEPALQDADSDGALG